MKSVGWGGPSVLGFTEGQVLVATRRPTGREAHKNLPLADEPTGALDSDNGAVVFSLLQAQARQGRIVIIATHNLDSALACDQIIALRDGHLVAPEVILPKRALSTPRRAQSSEDS